MLLLMGKLFNMDPGYGLTRSMPKETIGTGSAFTYRIGRNA